MPSWTPRGASLHWVHHGPSFCSSVLWGRRGWPPMSSNDDRAQLQAENALLRAENEALKQQLAAVTRPLPPLEIARHDDAVGDGSGARAPFAAISGLFVPNADGPAAKCVKLEHEARPTAGGLLALLAAKGAGGVREPAPRDTASADAVDDATMLLGLGCDAAAHSAAGGGQPACIRRFSVAHTGIQARCRNWRLRLHCSMRAPAVRCKNQSAREQAVTVRQNNLRRQDSTHALAGVGPMLDSITDPPDLRGCVIQPRVPNQWLMCPPRNKTRGGSCLCLTPHSC